jgi:hypothetical protein
MGRAWGFRIVALPVVLLICAAAFAQRSSASAALPCEVFSSGGRAVPGGSVDLRSGQLVPGDSVTGSVVVSNDGDAPGHIVFGTTSLAGADGDLATALRVILTDVTGGGRPHLACAGTLSGRSGLDLGSFVAGAVRAYRIAVSFPSEAASGGSCAGGSMSLSLPVDGSDG